MFSSPLWFSSAPPFPLAFDLVFLRWFGMVCFLSSLLITVFLYLVLSVVHPLTIVWMWWQGSCFPVTPSPPLIGRLPPSLCVNQHVYMLRMHLCMLGKPPVGGWTQLWLLKLFSSSSVGWFVTFLSWAFPLSSLSLPLVSKYAQRRVPLHINLCWHLVLQTVWEEVKGKCPLVYEDLLSETRNSAFLSFSWFSWFFCSLPRCLIAGFHLNHDKDELKIVLGYETCQHVFGMYARLRGPTLVGWQLPIDTWPIPSRHKLRTDKRIEACNKVFGTPGNTVDHRIFLLAFSLGLYWTIMLVLECMQCVDVYNHSVSCISGYCTPSVISCIFSIIRTLEQHLCVLGIARRGFGLCLLALAVHLWMLRPGHYGCCFDR